MSQSRLCVALGSTNKYRNDWKTGIMPEKCHDKSVKIALLRHTAYSSEVTENVSSPKANITKISYNQPLE